MPRLWLWLIGFAIAVLSTFGTEVPAQAGTPTVTNVRDYCSTVDGSTDNTACIQSAINAVCSASPGGGTPGLFSSIN